MQYENMEMEDRLKKLKDILKTSGRSRDTIKAVIGWEREMEISKKRITEMNKKIS